MAEYGEWVTYWDDDYLTYFYQCNKCGKDALYKAGTSYDQVLSHYCPNCGADMRGDNNG